MCRSICSSRSVSSLFGHQLEHIHPHCQQVSHKPIYEEQLCTSAMEISLFDVVHRPSFESTHHDC